MRELIAIALRQALADAEKANADPLETMALVVEAMIEEIEDHYIAPREPCACVKGKAPQIGA